MSEAPPASPPAPPRVYLLYGDDRSAVLDFVSSLAERVSGDPGMRELNITRLDGSKAGLEEIQSAAYALPFLTDRRLVIVTGPLEKIKSAKAQKQFTALLEGLPSSTALALVIHEPDLTPPPDKDRDKDKDQEGVKKGGLNLLKWAQAHPSLVYVRKFQVPHPSAMPGWILNEARRQGGRFTPQAAAALAELVGSDTGQARQEVTKLLTYVDGQRAVNLEDVQEAAFPGGQADVFAMVDSMALGDAPKALRQLSRLLEAQDPRNLFGMIVRQFRLLILTREAMLEGVTDAKTLAQRIHTTEFVAGKMLVQARHYSLTDLEGIYHRLLEIDKMMKTSQIDPDIALQTFVAGLAI